MHPSPIRVLLVDDHGILLKPLRILLASRPDVDVVGECSDGRQALDSAIRLQPDVILMDLNMPQLNGIEATRLISRDVPRAKVLILSSYADEDLVREAVRAGAFGYLVKRSDIDELILAMNTVQRGNTYFSGFLSESMDLHEIVYQARQPEVATAREVLTPREREILQLLAEGHSAKSIGAQLSISQKTVESHKTRMMPKIGARNRTDLLRFALRTGIVGLGASNESQPAARGPGLSDAGRLVEPGGQEPGAP